MYTRDGDISVPFSFSHDLIKQFGLSQLTRIVEGEGSPAMVKKRSSHDGLVSLQSRLVRAD